MLKFKNKLKLITMRKFLQKIEFWIKLLVLSPGVIIHELSHAFFCLITGTKIYKVVIFQFSEIAGYVEHQRATNIFSSFLISFGPLFLNTTLAFFLFQKFALKWDSINSLILLYFAISISLSAIPSNADGNAFGNYIKSTISKKWFLFLLFLFYPLVWILNLLNYLKKFKIDYFFTAGIFYFALFF